MDYRKTIENITCYICMTLIVLCIIIYFIAVEMIDSENKQKKQLAECDKCKGTGFVFYKKQKGTLWYDYVCRCNCLNGYQINKEIPTEQQLGIEE